MLPAGRLFHWGYAVPDLDVAMARFGEIFGVDWTPVARREMRVVAHGGEPQDLDFRICYSSTGPPHIELIEGPVGSIWDPTDEPRFHHVGLWAEDLDADSARLVDMGYPMVAHAIGDDGGLARFTYHENPYGPFIELVDPSTRIPFEKWMHGEPFVTP
jgi:hypothetical protein